MIPGTPIECGSAGRFASCWEENSDNVPGTVVSGPAANSGREQAICEYCTEQFVPARKGRRFCGIRCSARYARSQRRYVRATIEERFWKYVAKGEPGSCWEWQGAKDHHGYGRLNSPGHSGPVLKAHRVSYEIHAGPIERGLHVLHSCDNPPCVNPAHLRLGSPADNTEDRLSRGRGRSGGRYIHSDETVEAVRRALADGLSYSEIAGLLGVKRRWVQAVALGERRTKGQHDR
jgi:hypothetical protein